MLFTITPTGTPTCLNNIYRLRRKKSILDLKNLFLKLDLMPRSKTPSSAEFADFWLFEHLLHLWFCSKLSGPRFVNQYKFKHTVCVGDPAVECLRVFRIQKRVSSMHCVCSVFSHPCVLTRALQVCRGPSS